MLLPRRVLSVQTICLLCAMLLLIFGHTNALRTIGSMVKVRIVRDYRRYSSQILTETIDLTHQSSRESAYSSGTRIFKPALVLNADYSPVSFMPLSIWNWQDTLRATLSGKANVVSEYNTPVRSVSFSLNLPSVIVLTSFYKRQDSGPAPLSRKHIYIRDDFKCQYCLGTFSHTDLTLDHVLPRSRGGALDWTNLVTCCTKCNMKKGSKMPEELPALRMRLRRAPYAPSNAEIQNKGRKLYQFSNVHPHWREYLV